MCTALHHNDYQLCHTFQFANKSINGVHVKSDFFVMHFEEYEKFSTDLANANYYKSFKTMFREYPESTNLQKRVFRYEIHKQMMEVFTVISSKLH